MLQYLVSYFDEQDEDDENEQVVKDTNSSNDKVDDLQCQVADVGYFQRRIRWRRRYVVPYIIRRIVLHRGC